MCILLSAEQGSLCFDFGEARSKLSLLSSPLSLLIPKYVTGLYRPLVWTMNAESVQRTIGSLLKLYL